MPPSTGPPGHVHVPVWQVAVAAQSDSEQGVSSLSTVPTHSPTALQTSFCTHSFCELQAVPADALTSLQSPVAVSQLATRHCPDGGQTLVSPTHSPPAHCVFSKHLSVAEQGVVLALSCVVQLPSMAQRPTLQSLIPDEQSLGFVHEQVPSAQVPAVSQQPVAPQTPPVSLFDSHAPVPGLQLGVLWHSSWTQPLSSKPHDAFTAAGLLHFGSWHLSSGSSGQSPSTQHAEQRSPHRMAGQVKSQAPSKQTGVPEAGAVHFMSHALQLSGSALRFTSHPFDLSPSQSTKPAAQPPV